MTKFKMLFFLNAIALVLCISSCTSDSEEVNNRESSIETELRQIAIDFEPAPCAVVSNISIFITDDCGPNWTNGILDAIQAYNNTDTGINFVETQTQGNADISFDCLDFAEGVDPDTGDDFSNTIGLGEVPNEDGAIGAETFLNTDFETTCANPCFFQGVVMHEIGHNLGLFHNENTVGQLGRVGDIIDDGDGTFTFSDETDDFVWIEGTAPEGTNDPNSIFNVATGCFTANCAFNANDIIALETLYPRPANPCDCPLAFEPCDCAETAPKCVCPELETPCGCPDLFEPCACEESISITFPTIWEEEGCIPADQSLQICAYGWAGEPGPDVSYNWTSTGSIEIDSSNDERCVEIFVGTEGGTVSVWVENDNCGEISIHRTIEICEEDDGTVGTGGNGPGPGPKKGRPKDIE